MYYKQSTKNIQLVILSFDDVMFDLTRLRYNYYRRLCKLYNSPLDKNEFLNHLGSCRSMFSNSPIDAALLSKESLIAKIEEDLLAYSKMYGLKHRDGLVELMELFRQKNIKCIVTSTHPKQYTEPLFKVAALYHQPTEIMYDDPQTACLPDPDLYQKILEKYQLSASDVLLIAANRVSVLAANELRMNVVYIPGLEKVTKEMDIRCLKVVNSLLEIINLILEGGRITPLSDQYLLMRHDGDTQDLYQNYQYLLDVYRQDKEILAYIEPIYQEEFSKAQKINVEKTLQEQKEENQVSLSDTSDISVLTTLESALKDDTQKISAITEALKLNIEPDVPKRRSNPTMVQEEEQTDIKDDSKAPDQNPLKDLTETDESLTLDALSSDSETQSTSPTDNALLDMISEVSQNDPEPVKEDLTRTKIFTKEELKTLGIKEKDMLNENEDYLDDDEETDNQPALITSFIVNIGYALMNAIVITLIAGIAMIGLSDWLTPTESIFHFVWLAFNAVGDISMKIFGSLLNPIAATFNTSEMFIGTLAVILLLTIVLWICLDISSIIKKRRSRAN